MSLSYRVPALVLALAVVFLPTATADEPNLLANGTFDSSLSGWAAEGATLSRASDGLGGTAAALVSAAGSPNRFSIVATASSTTSAGVRYLADASVRSRKSGRRLCLAVEESTPSGSLAGSAQSCVSSTRSWQPFPQVAYVAAADGDTLAVRLLETQARRHDSFEADSVTLTAQATAPASTAPPTIAGTAQEGQTLTADPGTWSGTTPMSFAYRWQSSTDGTTWSDVPSGQEQTYTVASADVGRTLRVVVTATNGAGSSAAASAPTATVTGTTPPPPPPQGGICGTSTAAPPARYDHVIWIWLENRNYDQIIGAPGTSIAERSPFVNDTLVPQCGLATNYHNATHPSLPNYIAATSGSTWGLDRNGLQDYTVPSLYQQLEETQREWRNYDESMPSNCDHTSTDIYPANHNAPLNYRPLDSTCPLWDVPLGDTSTGALAQALANDTLPAFAFVVPDRCNSTHDCTVATGDAWLAKWVPLIADSPAYEAGRTAVFVTWDEGNRGTDGEDCLAPGAADTSCHVVLLALSPYTHAVQPATFFSHYSLLRTTEELLGLPFLAHAGDSSTQSMRAAFGL